MPLYTFYPHRGDGASLGLETHTLEDDADAARVAASVLEGHQGAAFVVCWRDDRSVITYWRDGLITAPANV